MIFEHLPVAACASLAQSSNYLYTVIKHLRILFHRLHRATLFERARRLANKLDHLYVGSRICNSCGQIHKAGNNSQSSFRNGYPREMQLDLLDYVLFDEVKRYWSEFATAMRAIRRVRLNTGQHHWLIHMQEQEVETVHVGSNLTSLAMSKQFETRPAATYSISNVYCAQRCKSFSHFVSLRVHTSALTSHRIRLGMSLRRTCSNFRNSHKVLFDAVEKLLASIKPQDAQPGLVYKALQCTQCVSELVITLKPTKTADIPVDHKDLRSCEWLIGIAQYVDLGIMEAPDEPE